MVLNGRADGERQWFRRERDRATGVELLRARLDDWSYGRHAHADYAVGYTEAGSQTFFCRGMTHRTRPGSVILFNPFDLHDGHASTADGVVYRMAYVPVDQLKTAFGEADGPDAEPGFAATVTDAPAVAAAVRGLSAALAEGELLARDEALVALAAALRAEAGLILPATRRADDRALRRAAERLNDDIAAEHRIAALAAEAGLDRFSLVRSFRRRYGMPPSAYLRTLRLESAKRRLALGEAPAEVAAATGFADQSHLNRWFRRAYGVTPGRYRQAAAAG